MSPADVTSKMIKTRVEESHRNIIKTSTYKYSGTAHTHTNFSIFDRSFKPN
eukprot:c41633_g1_i1 orf=156-308(-)